MKIEILEYIKGAKKAIGLTVVIDVFRAFSVACYIMNNGAEKIIPVGDLKFAYEMKKKYPDYLLIGERNEQIQPGFDYGNSPTHVKDVNFTGKSIIQTTGAGTQGIANATNADEIITGSFVNAEAIIKYIKKKKPKYISLVAMGHSGKNKTDEDIFCAQYIKNKLENKLVNFNEMYNILKLGSGKRFLNPENQIHAPSSDFNLCLNLNAFDFILKVEKPDNSSLFLKKITSELEK